MSFGESMRPLHYSDSPDADAQSHNLDFSGNKWGALKVGLKQIGILVMPSSRKMEKAARQQCLRTPDKTSTRQVSLFPGKAAESENHGERMKIKIDSSLGRTKVDAQWKLYCLVHNIEKLAHHGVGR